MKTEDKKNPLLPVVFIMGAIILGLVINMISGSKNKEDFGGAGWTASDEINEKDSYSFRRVRERWEMPSDDILC